MDNKQNFKIQLKKSASESGSEFKETIQRKFNERKCRGYCKFDKIGVCQNGIDCQFLHMDLEKLVQSFSKFEEQKNIHCKYFKKGFCFYGDNCKYLHEDDSDENKSDKTKPCIFYQKGFCRYGDECKYLHDTKSNYQNVKSKSDEYASLMEMQNLENEKLATGHSTRPVTNRFRNFESRQNAFIGALKSSNPVSIVKVRSNDRLISILQCLSLCPKFMKGIDELSNNYPDLTSAVHFRKQLKLVLKKKKTEPYYESFQTTYSQTNKTDYGRWLTSLLKDVYDDVECIQKNYSCARQDDNISLPMKQTLLHVVRCGCGMISQSPVQTELFLYLSINPKLTLNVPIQSLIDWYFAEQPVLQHTCFNRLCKGKNTIKQTVFCKPLSETICLYLQQDSRKQYSVESNSNRGNIVISKEIIIKSEYFYNPSSNEAVSRDSKLKNSFQNVGNDNIFELKAALVHGEFFGMANAKCDNCVRLIDGDKTNVIKENQIWPCEPVLLFYERCG